MWKKSGFFILAMAMLSKENRTTESLEQCVFRYRVSSGHGHNVHHLRYLGTLNSTEDRELSGRVFYRYKPQKIS